MVPSLAAAQPAPPPGSFPSAVPPTRAQAVAPINQGVPVPDSLELAKLIWTTMAAVDAANQAGNYSVLRDLAAPGFQINNDPAQLAAIFASLRQSRIDLSNTLLLAPTYRGPPTVSEGNVLRVQGSFLLRPVAINFDLHFQWVSGRWRLFGVSIAPLVMAAQAPGMPTAPSRVQEPTRARRAR